ncbi:MAG: Gfo/Idh/MocA family oxidoreductase [Thermoguttaceae bacterium]|jgi:predicted dehydrogenase
MKTYNVGILGFGMIGKVHAYGHLNLPFCYDPVPLATRITHVVASRQETAEKARQATGAAVAATDFRVATEDPSVDIVHVCTPNHLHCEALLSAMRQQKHIYCDKPLAASMDEARRIEAALADYRGTAQMTFQYRFYPATLRARQLVEDGAIGEVLAFRATYLHGGSADPQAPMRWKFSRAAGGGVITDLASHLFDLVEHLAGPIGSLLAETRVAYPERPSADNPAEKAAVDAEDSAVLLARLASGALGTIEATKLAAGSEDELRLEIHGTRGALRFSGMDPHHLEFHDATVPDRPCGGSRGWTRINSGGRYPPPATGFPNPKAPIGWLSAHVACLANFLAAIAEGRPAAPDLRQGLRVERLMDAARRSAAERRWIPVNAVSSE